MDSALETKLIECLGALESGESLEQALSRFPEDAERLRPLLSVAAALPRLRMEPSLEAKAASRKAFLAKAAAMPGATRPRRALLMRPLAAFASLAAALVVVAGVAVTTSASAVPGDPLYGVKRAVESVLLSISSDRVTLAAQFEQERIDEVEALLAAGREAEVEFGGIVESIQPNAWVVSGVPVALDGNTAVEGDPQVGRRARVRGRTIDGLLIATSIAVEPGAEPSPEPTVEPQPESSATPTPRQTPTPGATHTPSPSPSPTSTRTPTATPTPAEIRFEGVVERADAQTWTISGLVVEVNAATEFVNNPAARSRVAVRALSYPDGRLLALRIERIDGGGENTNTNENRNDNENQNDNLNENDDNSNDNGNGNDNGNSNDNSNDNGNGNDNSNDNDSSGKGNDNGNSNENGSSDSRDPSGGQRAADRLPVGAARTA